MQTEYRDREVDQPRCQRHPRWDLAEQPYLARRQNWVNQLERHAFMLPGATALRFLVTPPPGADLRERVARVAPPVGMLPNFLTST
jgi:hypothetical protein